MPFCRVEGCDSNKIENRDLGLCASHNRIRREAEKPLAVKERKPIAQVSAKREAHLKQRRVAYTQVKKEQERCACCGCRFRLTPSHVLTQNHFKHHAANPRNIIVLCQTDHDLWEHHKEQFALMFPDVWALKMQIMEELEPEYFQQFKAKHQSLFV